MAPNPLAGSASPDGSHDPALRSWVDSADGHPDFPVQNLPLGIVSADAGTAVPAVAIGDHAIDLAALAGAGVLTGEALRFVDAARSGTLNGALALGAGPRQALRSAVSLLLRHGAPGREQTAACLRQGGTFQAMLPAAIGDYTDFYVGIHHATAVGKLFRPDAPLLPNYKHVPIGYHGRSSSIRPSGTVVLRPNGQTKAPDADLPVFGPCRRLDFELELGIWIGAGNELGERVAVAQAANHIAGFCLLNDWSARDVQAWEYQPLGPFLAKNFASTVSPWIITPEALLPFRQAQAPRPPGDPAPLAYLADARDQEAGALLVELEVSMRTAAMREAGRERQRIALSHARHMYWTPAQLVAHHTSNGCNLCPGDLMGTGTISGPDRGAVGSLLEATLGGKEPLALGEGEQRTFLEDGDEVVLTARAVRDGWTTIGFGECLGTIAAAPA